MLHKTKTLAVFFLNLPIWYFSLLLVPKRKNLWVFGAWSGKRYADNSKSLFEYVNEHAPEVDAVWVTRNQAVYDQLKADGYRVVKTYSLAGYWTCMRAGWVVLTLDYKDVNRFATTTANRIQLYHGSALKKVGADDSYRFSWRNRQMKRWLFTPRYEGYRYVCAASECVAVTYRTAFPDAKEVVVTGYPRNDSLGGVEPEKWITYLPTHRNFGKQESTDLFCTLEVADLEQVLEKSGYRLKIKLHPFHTENLDRFGQSSLIELVDSKMDVCELLSKTAILITDYSSVYFDFLLTDRPIIFAPFDFEQYVSENRELYYNYEEVTPGPKCMNWAEVIDEISRFVSGEDRFQGDRKSIRSQFNCHEDFHSSRRVLELLRGGG